MLPWRLVVHIVAMEDELLTTLSLIFSAVDSKQPFLSHDLDVSPRTRHQGLLLQPMSWPSYWAALIAEGMETRPIPWPPFAIGLPSKVCCSSVVHWNFSVIASVHDLHTWTFRAHRFLSVQVCGIGLTSRSNPKKLFHIGACVYNTWQRWYNLSGCFALECSSEQYGTQWQSWRILDQATSEFKHLSQKCCSQMVVQETLYLGKLSTHASYLSCFGPEAIHWELVNYKGIQFYPCCIGHSQEDSEFGVHHVYMSTSTTLLLLLFNWHLFPYTKFLVGKMAAFRNSSAVKTSGNSSHQHYFNECVKLWPSAAGTNEKILGQRSWQSRCNVNMAFLTSPNLYRLRVLGCNSSAAPGFLHTSIGFWLGEQHLSFPELDADACKHEHIHAASEGDPGWYSLFCDCSFDLTKAPVVLSVNYPADEILSKRSQDMSCMASSTCYNQDHFQEGRGVIAFADVFTQGCFGYRHYIGFDCDGYFSVAFPSKVINHNTNFNRVSVGHDYYYLKPDNFSELVQVHLDHGCYRDNYHGDSGMIKDLQAPWDPGKIFVIAAWGQAAFQEGRDVRDLPWPILIPGLSPLIAHGPGPSMLTTRQQPTSTRKQATSTASSGSRNPAAAAIFFPFLLLPQFLYPVIVIPKLLHEFVRRVLDREKILLGC